MTDAVAKAFELLDAGDVPATMRHLRFHLEECPLGDQARITARLADAAGFDDLGQAAAALASDPEHPQHQFDFGYTCIERGAEFLALPALRALVEALPHEPAAYRELAAALEAEERHGEAVELLRGREEVLEDWPDRYLLAYNAVLSGDVELARSVAEGLSEPDDEGWRPARNRLRRVLSRAATAALASPLDDRDLRGWHFVLTGGLLAHVASSGFDSGMNGRYAWLQEDYAACRSTLTRMEAALRATGRQPSSVGVLPDRDSEILGLAAAELLGVPARPFTEPAPEELVVAYNLAEIDRELLKQLYDRTSGQVLYEHAMCWTKPPTASADITGLMHQVIHTPWDSHLRAAPEGGTEQDPADDRPAQEIAEELARTEPEDPGDDEDPPVDSEEQLADFAARVSADWLVGPREWIRSSGPVGSNRFA